MEDPLRKTEGAVFRTPHGRMFVNRGKAPEIFYDSNMEPIVIPPGGARFEAIIGNLDFGQFFLSPELWNAYKATQEISASKGSMRVLIDVGLVDRYGDHLLSTIFPKAYKDAYGDKVTVEVGVMKAFESVWRGNPYVDATHTRKEKGLFELPGFDIRINANDLELKFREKQLRGQNEAYEHRSDILLKALGLFVIDRIPVYEISDEEREWAKSVLKGLSRPLIGVGLHSVGKCKIYPGMPKVIERIKQKGLGVIILDKVENGKFDYSFREMAALVSQCNVVISVDSAILHIAGALKKRIIGVFGNTDGKIFTEDYEKALVIQAPCALRRKETPCWWTVDCLPGKSYQEKEQAGVAKCLDRLSPEKIMETLECHLKKPRKLLMTMLTYNLKEMTSKALASIQSFHDYEIFVVDNESTDGTQEWLKKQRISFVSKKTSVAEAQNIAMKKFMEGDYDKLVLLNNDLVLRYDTINRLMETAEKIKAFGITATPMERIAPWDINSTKPQSHDVAVIADIPAGSYSCTVFSRECIEKVGFFNERFKPRYIEDNDYTLRIRLARGQFVQDYGAIYYHALGGVVKSNREEGKKHIENWNKNVALYREIWGIDPHERQQLSKLGPEWHGGMPISDIQDSLKKERRVTVLIKRGMGGYGDILFSTVIARELKALGKKCRVVYAVPDRYRCVLTNNPNIDAIYLHDNPVPEGCSYSIDITDVEFRIEQIEMQKYGEIKSPRTKIYLNLIHSDSDNLKPDYFVMDEERLWAERLWKMPEKKKRILIVEKGSNKLKVWKPIRSLGIKLANQHSVVISFEDDTSFTFRQAAALVSLADLVVSPDSGLSNLAGALNVPVLTLFSNRNGSVFSKMFKSMRPIQGKCSLFPKRNYCDFFTPCLGSGPHRAKENIRIPDCMTHLDLEQVLKVAKEMLEADR